MVRNKTKSFKGKIVLSVFAIAFTLMPVVTMGLWTHHMFFSDNRRSIELARVESAADPRLFDEPLISVTFDDGWESIYSSAAPVMSEYGVVSTQYIVPGEFSRPIYMSAQQALSMKRAGHEISSHTYSHQDLTKASDAKMRQEIDRSVEVLRKLQLLDDGQLTFAAPHGALHDASRSYVKTHFALARNVNGDLSNGIDRFDMNLRGYTDRYDIIGYTVGRYTTIEQLEAALAYASEHNAWFIPVYHQIDNSGERYSVTPDDFRRHMQLFRDSGIKTVTMRDVLIHNQEKL